MTVAERLRRRGWRGPICGMWRNNFQGVDVVVWPYDGDDLFGGPATMVIDTYHHGEQTFRFGTEGLPSLAQRAKSAARKLARQRGRR